MSACIYIKYIMYHSHNPRPTTLHIVMMSIKRWSVQLSDHCVDISWIPLGAALHNYICLWFSCTRNKSPTMYLSGMEHVLVKDTQSQEWKRSLWLEGCQSFRYLGTDWMKGWETNWEWQHQRVCLCFAFCNNIIINCLISQKAIHPNTIPRDQRWPNNEWLL